MTPALYAVGRFCVRRHRLVLAAWLVLVVGLGFTARTIELQTADNLTLPGTGSQSATDVLDDRFPSQANGTNPVVFAAQKGKLTSGANRKAVEKTVKALQNDSLVSSVTSPLSAAGADQLSRNEKIGYASVILTESASELSLDDARHVVDLADTGKRLGLTVAVGGYVGTDVSKADSHSSEAIGIFVAMIVLAFTFGTVVAMGLPIVTAIVGLVSGLSLVTLLALVITVPTVGPTLGTMMGLGVGIDYALFIVSRFREYRSAGLDIDEAIARSVATTGGAIVFAGSTVIVALLSLAIVGIPLVSALGYTAAIVVAAAVVGAITLLPALLAAVGPRIDSLRVPGTRRHREDDHPHGWERWARGVAAHPVSAVLASLVLLGVLAYPMLDMRLGQTDNGSLPGDTQSRRSYDLLTEGFGVGTNGPLLVSVSLVQPAKPDKKKLDQVEAQQQQLEAGPQTPQATSQEQQLAQEEKELQSPASDPRLQTLQKDLEKTKGVDSVSAPLVNKAGTAAIYNVIPTTSPSDFDTQDLVDRLRDSVIPAAEKGNGYTAYVGGTTAGYIDLADEISGHLIEVILIVVALSCLLLMIAFRSVPVPLASAVMNLISIGAAYGVITWVFQDGHLTGVIGLDGSIPIVSYLPLMMFAILFGLSMDYQMFLLTHVREEFKKGHRDATAVIRGLALSGRIITSAALIMVSVFASFIINSDPTVKQFGVGLAAAIAVDATIVRCLLVPAVLVLMGPGGWWMPRWLDRLLPSLNIEGNEYFEERDAKTRGAA